MSPLVVAMLSAWAPSPDSGAPLAWRAFLTNLGRLNVAAHRSDEQAKSGPLRKFHVNITGHTGDLEVTEECAIRANLPACGLQPNRTSCNIAHLDRS